MTELSLFFTLGALAALLLFDLRRRAAERHRTELQHIQSSTVLLHAHASALEQFLASDDAPDSLKTLLVRFSDDLADRASNVGIAELLSQGARTTRGADEVAAELRRLPAELSRTFAKAVVTGSMAAVLRWPDTASEFERLSAEMFAGPQREEALIEAVARVRRPEMAIA